MRWSSTYSPRSLFAPCWRPASDSAASVLLQIRLRMATALSPVAGAGLGQRANALPPHARERRRSGGSCSKFLSPRASHLAHEGEFPSSPAPPRGARIDGSQQKSIGPKLNPMRSLHAAHVILRSQVISNVALPSFSSCALAVSHCGWRLGREFSLCLCAARGSRIQRRRTTCC